MKTVGMTKKALVPCFFVILGAAALFLPSPARGQLVMTYGFAPNANVPDNGQITDSRTLGGFASYSNVTVNLTLGSPNAGNPMVLGDLYSTLTIGLPSEMQRVAVLLNRPGRNNNDGFGSTLSSLNVTLDDSAARTNIFSTTSSSGTYNSDGRLGVGPRDPAVAFNEADRNATLAALQGSALPSHQFNLLVADTADGGLARLDGWGMSVTGAAAAGGTLSAAGGTMSIGDTGSGAVNNLGAAVVTTQPSGGAGTLVVNIAGAMTMSGGVSGTSGLTKQGSGMLTIDSPGTFGGATVISANGGTLNAAAAGAFANSPSITVNSGGTLLLSGAGDLDRVNNAASITLAGGTIQKGAGASEGSSNAIGLGALSLAASSFLDFASSAGTLTFASFAPGSSLLSILNYQGNGSPMGFDQLVFNESQASQLSSFDFGFGPGMNVGHADLGGGFFEVYALVPVPEPGTWAAGALTLMTIAARYRRRIVGRFSKIFAA